MEESKGGGQSRQRNQHNQRPVMRKRNELHERRPMSGGVRLEEMSPERSNGAKSVFLLWNSHLAPSAPSGWPSSQRYSTVILTPATLAFPRYSNAFTTLSLILGQIGHMAGWPQHRNPLSHLPWVMFRFSSWASDFYSMGLLFSFVFFY